SEESKKFKNETEEKSLYASGNQKKRSNEELDTSEEPETKRYREFTLKRANDTVNESIPKRRKLKHHDGTLVTPQTNNDDPDDFDQMILDPKKRKVIEPSFDDEEEPITKKPYVLYIEV